MRSQEWESLVDPYFGFLRTEFGCRVVETAENKGWRIDVVYQNPTTAVRVSFDNEFDDVEAWLIRLVNGSRPPYPIFVSEESRLHHFSMAQLVRLRDPAKYPVARAAGGLEPKQVAQQLSMWAEMVREYASDVLRGDFSVFEAMEREIRDMVRQHPEQIGIAVPQGHDVTDDPIIQKLRRDHPYIPIEVQWYTRRPRRSALERLRRWLRGGG